MVCVCVCGGGYTLYYIAVLERCALAQGTRNFIGSQQLYNNKHDRSFPRGPHSVGHVLDIIRKQVRSATNVVSSLEVENEGIWIVML